MQCWDNLRVVDRKELYDTEIWKEVWGLLEKASGLSGEYDEESIFRGIISADMQLWVAEDKSGIYSAATTQIIEYPNIKVCLVHLCGGKDHKIKQWVDHILTIRAWAKSLGCDSIESRGRKGWSKLLAKYGFNFEYEVTRCSV